MYEGHSEIIETETETLPPPLPKEKERFIHQLDSVVSKCLLWGLSPS